MSKVLNIVKSRISENKDVADSCLKLKEEFDVLASVETAKANVIPQLHGLCGSK